MKIKLLKGGEGSGNYGHAGRPGDVGGSAAGSGGSVSTGAKSTEVTRLEEYFKANSDVAAMKSRVADAKKSATDYEKRFYREPERKDYWRKLETESWDRYEALKAETEQLSQKVKTQFKDIKAPGYGEWKRKVVPGVVGSDYYYNHPEHPEYGEMRVNHFSGYRMQHVAPFSTVSYAGGEFSWSGGEARQKANAFLSKVFGV